MVGAPRLQLLTLSLQRNQIRDRGVIALAGFEVADAMRMGRQSSCGIRSAVLCILKAS